MTVGDIMTPMPIAVTVRDTVSFAAELMRHEHIGSVPVVSELAHRKLVGIITDRDIAVRCVAAGHDGRCIVAKHMSPAPLQTVHAEEDINAAVVKMERFQVRRIPVVAEEDVLVGIVTQADLARKIGPTDPALVEEVVERVSEPAVAIA